MDSPTCNCWRCWFQKSFTAIVLLSIVILAFLATVILMHEEMILDKYVIWLEGFTGGAMTALSVALSAPAPTAHRDTTVTSPAEAPKP